MSTRKLILLALACGLAILVAGSIQLLRINHGSSATLAVGDSMELATVTAQVSSASVEADRVRVVVHLAVASSASGPLKNALVGWSLLTGGLKKPVGAVKTAADALPSSAALVIPAGRDAVCVVAFPAVPTVKDTSYVTFVFAGRSATWQLGI